MSDASATAIAIIVCAAAILIIVACYRLVFSFYTNPFHFPYLDYTFDVSGKRNVRIEDYIDEFLNDPDNWKMVLHCEQNFYDWEDACMEYISTCHFKKHRMKQFESVKDYSSAYRFYCMRTKTRYKQVNYQKYTYHVNEAASERFCNFDWLEKRHRKLEEIGYEATLNDYNARDQRKLMTRKLREKIMKRDNYTCQICGKYMPDEVGLQIDHIIPVSRGGKTVESNLRVLCNKCNAKKGSKFDEEM